MEKYFEQQKYNNKPKLNHNNTLDTLKKQVTFEPKNYKEI